MVNGSYNEIPLIASAHKAGYFVITSGNDPHGDGHRYSDQYIPADYSDMNAILKIAKEENIDAICSCGNDFGAITASFVADQMNFSGHDRLEVCKCFHEKDHFKRVCEELSLKTPRSYPFGDEAKALEHLKDVIFPQIIKPSDLGGGKGISVVNNYEEGVVAVKAAFKASKVKTILIEDYIKGEQKGFTCYIKNKKVEFTYFTDDYSYLNPYMVWVAIPHREGEDLQLVNNIVKDVELMADHLDMADGMLTIQIIVREGVPYYIETMRRCLGNLHYRCLSWDLGIDVYDLFVKTELGEDVSSILKKEYPLQSYSAFMGIYADRNGVFKGYSVNDEFKKYLKDEMLLEQIGFNIDNYLGQKLGMLFLSFKTVEERDYFINNMRNVVKVEVE